MPLDVALASCVSLPEPDADMPPLLAALRGAGVTAEALGWDDPAAQPELAGARLVLLRSTWNYSLRPREFLEWVDRTARATRLFNPAETVRWNAPTSYLLDLRARGVPVVPTTLLRRGDATPLRDVVPDVPESVEHAVMHALAKDPAERPTARELGEELLAAFGRPRVG